MGKANKVRRWRDLGTHEPMSAKQLQKIQAAMQRLRQDDDGDGAT